MLAAPNSTSTPHPPIFKLAPVGAWGCRTVAQARYILCARSYSVQLAGVPSGNTPGLERARAGVVHNSPQPAPPPRNMTARDVADERRTGKLEVLLTRRAARQPTAAHRPILEPRRPQ